MKIRELQWADFPALLENYYALYEEVRENPDLGISLFHQRPTLGAEADWFAGMFRRVQDGDGVVVVAEEDGRAVGICTVDRKAKEREGHHIGVLGILIGRAWRRRGIGQALLEQAIDRCRGKFELIELSVFATNAHARRLYESLGFRTWGILPKGILRQGRHIDLEHMVLDLGSS